ncbi:uncharacterized protein LOC114296544 [Camellia sinensis]|uniref:uncharacterized protein LOC114296544 n=1 Tax=Camellia sinensis TaxID=4442 RepID=UPI00103599DF|nr:uncharacterized protein LOC114296544 [Camellia sinensis]
MASAFSSGSKLSRLRVGMPTSKGDGYLYDVGMHIWLQCNYNKCGLGIVLFAFGGVCGLDNDEEFQNILFLAKSMGLHHVKVVVDLKNDNGQSSSSGLLRVGDVRTSKNPRFSSDLVSSTISEIVRDKPLTRLCEVMTILKRDYGLEVSYYVVRLSVEKANAVIHEDHSLSFDQLRWYSDAVMRYNLGSYVNIDYDGSNQQFCRFFVSFITCISEYNSCRPLLFLDGTFLKGKYKGHLFAATTKDGNNGLFHVAFAIVDLETTVNWSWFLHELGKVVDGKRQITFISDRNLGLSEAMPKVFSSVHHSYCLQHLKNNLRDQMKGI